MGVNTDLVRQFLDVLNFYFRHEDRLKKMAETLDPDNPAQEFINWLKRYSTSDTLPQNLGYIILTKSLIQDHFKKEDQRNADKQTACSEDC